MSGNTIEKLGLEQLAYDLKLCGKSYREIATTLTETSETPISYSTVRRYFEAHENIREELTQSIIDKTDTVLTTAISQTLDIQGMRIRLTSSLLSLLDKKLKHREHVDGREIAALAKEIREGLNDMKENNPLTPVSCSIDNNIGDTLTDDDLIRIIKLTEVSA